MKWGFLKFSLATPYFNIGNRDCYFNYVAPEEEADKDKPDYKGPASTVVTVPGV